MYGKELNFYKNSIMNYIIYIQITYDIELFLKLLKNCYLYSNTIGYIYFIS